MKKTFTTINREKLLAKADHLAVLRAYTQVGKENGNKIELLCPFHNDRKIGNCWYYKKDNKIYCFSCHKGGNIIDVVMEKNGYTESSQAYDAMREIARISGLDLSEVSDEVSPEDQKKMAALPPMPSQEELKLLGLYNDPVRVTCYRENNPEEEYHSDSYITNPLGRLRQDDPEGFKTLIISKARERIAEDNEEIKKLRISLVKSPSDSATTLVMIRSVYGHQKQINEVLRKYLPEE